MTKSLHKLKKILSSKGSYRPFINKWRLSRKSKRQRTQSVKKEKRLKKGTLEISKK